MTKQPKKKMKNFRLCDADLAVLHRLATTHHTTEAKIVRAFLKMPAHFPSITDALRVCL